MRENRKAFGLVLCDSECFGGISYFVVVSEWMRIGIIMWLSTLETQGGILVKISSIYAREHLLSHQISHTDLELFNEQSKLCVYEDV